MGHRTAAGLIFIWILIIAIHVIRNYKDQRVIYWGWIIYIYISLFTSMYRYVCRFDKTKSYISALLHSLFISLLFGLLCYMILLIIKK